MCKFAGENVGEDFEIAMGAVSGLGVSLPLFMDATAGWMSKKTLDKGKEVKSWSCACAADLYDLVH